jgi:excisionase family DNA binding protein
MTAAEPQGATPASDRLHDIDTAADYLRCGRRLIYRLVAERKIRFTYASRSLRFWQSDLDAYLNARTVEPDDAHSPHR